MFSISGNYLPFEVTASGKVVVSAPLVFRNSIVDMIIVNVTIRNKIREGLLKNNTDTNVTLNIAIEKSGQIPYQNTNCILKGGLVCK